jgi:2-amino-4-hydroxy-6-hydroxymethyldihydropteridine diphosphokinase
MFKKAIIGLGGNVGDRKSLLESAINQCKTLGNLILESSIYETAAWGGVAEGSFLNQVILLETDLNSEDLLKELQAIENSLGRERAIYWGDRTMDIDILFFADELIQTATLTIPHPAISSRKFVLIPLAEILPDFIHPVLEKSSLQLFKECEDKSEVNLFKVSN